jgi:hypothetical protein
VSEEQLQQIGRLADKCDDYAAASRLPMPAPFHVAQLRAGLEDLSRELRALYVAIAGRDPWKEEETP